MKERGGGLLIGMGDRYEGGLRHTVLKVEKLTWSSTHDIVVLLFSGLS